ncbi:hypothetical protein [Nostoc sp. CALU 1950]
MSQESVNSLYGMSTSRARKKYQSAIAQFEEYDYCGLYLQLVNVQQA